MARASGVQVRIELPRLPQSPALTRHLRAHPEHAHFAYAGGEDYELVLAVPPASRAAFERACKRAGEPVTEVGRVAAGRGVLLLDADGRQASPRATGHDHFR